MPSPKSPTPLQKGLKRASNIVKIMRNSKVVQSLVPRSAQLQYCPLPPHNRHYVKCPSAFTLTLQKRLLKPAVKKHSRSFFTLNLFAIAHARPPRSTQNGSHCVARSRFVLPTSPRQQRQMQTSCNCLCRHV